MFRLLSFSAGLIAVQLICYGPTALTAQDTYATSHSVPPMRCLTNDIRIGTDDISKAYDMMWESARLKNDNVPMDLFDFRTINKNEQESGSPEMLDSTQYAADDVLSLRKMASASFPKLLSDFESSREFTNDVDLAANDAHRLSRLHEIASFLCLYSLDKNEEAKALEHLLQAVDANEVTMQMDGFHAQIVLTRATSRNLYLVLRFTSRFEPPPSVITKLREHVNKSMPNPKRLRDAIALSSTHHLDTLVEDYRKQGALIEEEVIKTLTAKSIEAQTFFQYDSWDKSYFGPDKDYPDRTYDIFDTRVENLEGQLIGGIILNYCKIVTDEQWRRICLSMLAMLLDDLDGSAVQPVEKYLQHFKVAEHCVTEVVSDQERRLIVKMEPQNPESDVVSVVVVPRIRIKRK